MLEAELAFCNNLQPLLSIMEELIKKAAIDILERGAKDLAVVSNFHKENIEVYFLLSNAVTQQCDICSRRNLWL